MTFLTTLRGQLSDSNSSETPLGGGSTFTGTAIDIAAYNAITVSVIADVASASGGLELQFGSDAKTWDKTYTYTVAANEALLANESIYFQYFRVRYTNGSSAQTTFRLQTIVQPISRSSDSIRTTLTNGISLQRQMYDEFYRLRIGAPVQLFDDKFYVSKSELLFDEITATGGTAILSVPNPTIVCNVGAAVGSRVVRQTRQYFPYQPGKAFEVLLTGVLETSGGKEGITSRIGLFDDSSDKTVGTLSGDGFFFQLSGTTLSVVRRASIPAPPQTDTVVEQKDWNLDTFDGTGASGITLDPSARQIFFINMEWLGVGSVTMGFVIDGLIWPCHRWLHANQALDDSKLYPYSTRGSLPVRYEIRSTGANTGTLNQICSSVVSNGGFEPRGRKFFTASNGVTQIEVKDTEIPLLSIRLATTAFPERNRVTLNPSSLHLVTTTGGNMKYAVYRFLAPSAGSPLTGASWTAIDNGAGINPGSAAEFDVSATAVDLSGTFTYAKVAEGYYSNDADESFQDLEGQLLCIADIAGNSDIIVITAVRLTGGTEDTFAALSWQEYE